MNQFQEVNFDGLVGPTHHFGGLSVDNLASDTNRDATSNPQRAALQGLEKMKTLHDMGYPQAVLPPLPRPFIALLRAYGFGPQNSSDQTILKNTASAAPHLLSAVSSASSMWTANAATMAPSCDTIDGRPHFVTANLTSKLHRAIEAPHTYHHLRQVFGSDKVHPALPGGQAMGDEGAANHTRLAPDHGTRGIHVFVYGRDGTSDKITGERFVARQTRLASEGVARLLNLQPDQTVFVRQNQDVIDAGVFHNDVIAVGNLDCYFSHEKAYTKGANALTEISESFQKVTGSALHHIIVPNELISVERAVKTYLFNSQLIGPSNDMTLVAPQECKEDTLVSQYLQSLCDNPNEPIQKVLYFNLRESMRNGGGPACLRLRVVLNNSEIENLHARVMLDDQLYEDLKQWVRSHYREQLHLSDLSDIRFIHEVKAAYEELQRILKLQFLID